MTDQVLEPVQPVTPFNAAAPVAPAPVAPVVDLQPVAPVAPVAPLLPESVQELVGEGKKYSSADEALRSIPHAQSHIEKLEDEMANLRETIARNKSAEEVLEAINKTPSEPVTEPQFSQEQLDALIDNRITAKTETEFKAQNTQAVVDRFVEEYGDPDKAHEAWVQKSKDLGLNETYLNDLSAKSPKAVYELFGLKPKQPTPPKRVTNINSEAFINQAPATPDKRPSIMSGSTNAQDIAAWKAAAPTE